jgi:methionyl-tRNA formyltransferase
MEQQRQPDQIRLLYCGTAGAFSLQPLWHLLAAGLTIGAILVPGRKAQAKAAPIEELVQLPGRPISQGSRHLALPIINAGVAQSVIQVGWDHNIPVFRLNCLDHPQTVQALAKLAPDVACVACFPYRIPTALLNVPPAGFLNLHPSLLPAYRGPAPLFWTFRNGEQGRTGVTVHFMDEGLDTGDIALQAPLALPDGISGFEAERRSAALAGQLLVEAVQVLAGGRLPRRPQPPGGRYHPWPAPEDFTLNPAWPARRAFNFMRGTAEWRRAYTICLAGEKFALQTAVSFNPGEELGRPYVRSGRSLRIQFSAGVVDAVLVEG